MKKLLILATTIFMLAGCSGSNEPKKETKTCSMDVSGLKMDIKLDAENDIIHNLGMNITIPGSLFGGDVSVLSENDLKLMGEQVLSQLNVKQGEGITSNFAIKDKDLSAEVVFDLKKVDQSVLENFGFNGNSDNLKLSDAVKDLEAGGATCK